ncbi:type II secretion system protein GspL [Paludibacterium sp. B53371]|uniref:type II secretion system protein GspL n=1 Tax=Paludibacterium sp. B53371 TaxID=2806263 RepID=UPI001C041148|nr:type II secretion system protein GspL [Paludibacterium sp. B53371]
MSVLRVYLSATTAESEVLWSLSDAQGRTLSSGQGGVLPRGADQCLLVLAAGTSRCARVALPGGTRRQTSALIAYALEEGLLNEAEDNRYASLPDRTDLRVCLTAQAPLQAVLGWLGRQGVAVSAIVPEEQCLPLPPADTWVVARREAVWAVRFADGQTLCVPHQGDALWATLRRRGEPQQLWLCGDSALPDALADLPWRRQPDCRWQQAQPVCAHDFSPPLARWWRTLRRVPALCREGVVLLSLLSLLEGGWLMAQWGWLSWQRAQLVAQMQQLAQPMGVTPRPAGAEVLDQARQQLAQRRLQHGLAQDGDLLPMLAALPSGLAEAGALQGLHYRQGLLTLQGSRPFPRLSREQSRLLAQGGWHVAQADALQLTLRFAARPDAEGAW